MNFRIYAVSDKGCVRDHNEDMVLLGNIIFRDDRRILKVDLNEEFKKLFVAVADGMGGHSAGDVASEIILLRMAEKIDTLELGLSQKELSERISEFAVEIHKYILDEGNMDIQKKGMGSTLIGLLFYDGMAYYINVGDSRLYRFRRGNLMQISTDHSLREMTGNKNIASNIIINSFGGGEKIFVDFAPVGSKILDGDILLLCSDGLSDMLSDDEIEIILSKENPVDRLLSEAKTKGGIDNISIVSIQVQL
ncbi:MAG: serine/threonine-protein phosphatase [Candidatus Brocadiales bacterium]|nr:serine/threonine-protein phosphatase [Candidatus Brocadiales bacterium]